MSDGIKELKELAQLIRYARVSGENTAERVGRTFEGIVDMLSDVTLDKLRAIFLNKDREDQTEFLQKFLGGLISTYIQSPGFVSGPMGAGFTLKQNEDGTTYAEVDKLMVRMKAIFQSLEIMKTELAGASFMFNASGARMTIVRTERFDHQPAEFADGSEAVFSDGSRAVFAGAGEPFIRCWFVADDGDTAIENRFRVGNLVRSQTFNIKAGVHEGVSNRFWWREVIGVGDDYIDIAIARCAEGSDLPAEGDVCVQLGDLNDIDYQSAIVLSAYGEGAPYFTMYQGINSYSLADRDVFSIGYDKMKKECYVRNYGRMYMGDRNRNRYFDFDGNRFVVAADEIRLGGRKVEDIIIDETRVTRMVLDATGLDENKYYPVTFNLWTGNAKVRIIVSRTLDTNYGVPSYATHGGGFDCRCVWTTNAAGWGTAPVFRNIEYYSATWVRDGEPVIGDIGQLSNGSYEFIHVRGGSKYNITVEGILNAAIALHTDTFTNNGQSVYVEDNITPPVPSLAETGIDIYNHTVKVTADNFYVSSTSGTPIAVFTIVDGKPVLKAEHIDVDNLKVKHLDGADGTFSGTLTAVKGEIGGFSIGSNYIGSTSSAGGGYGSLSIYNDYIRVGSSDTVAYIGSDLYPATLGGQLEAAARFETKRSAPKGAGNIGIHIDVTGAKHYDDSDNSGNHALFIKRGHITGFRPGVRRIGSNTTLNVMDTIVIVITRGVTVTLPNSPEDGQLYIIRNASSGDIYIKSNKQNIRAYGDINKAGTQIHNETGQTNIIFYDAANDSWFPGYTNRW